MEVPWRPYGRSMPISAKDRCQCISVFELYFCDSTCCDWDLLEYRALTFPYEASFEPHGLLSLGCAVGMWVLFSSMIPEIDRK